MTQNALALQMRSAAIFEHLSTEQLSRIALDSSRCMFQEGQTIADCGETSSAATLVIEGAFRCTAGVGAGREFGGSPSGTVIGEMAMFIDDFVHPSTFVATGRVKAILIHRDAMLRQMSEDPDLAARLVEQVASRLTEMSATMRQIEGTAGLDMPLGSSGVVRSVSSQAEVAAPQIS